MMKSILTIACVAMLMAESISKCKFTKSFCKLLHQE